MSKKSSGYSFKLDSKCRQSITFSQEQHSALVMLAEKNQVSIGWIVRYACDQLIREHCDHQLLPNLTLPKVNKD